MPGFDSFITALKQRPLIAAVRETHEVIEVCGAPVPVVFFLGGSITTLPEMVQQVKASGKYAMIHIDLCAGLGRDEAAIEWCAKIAKPDGIISTRSPLIKYASSLGIITIQRLFLMDSMSFSNGMRIMKSTPPDMVEVLPGIVPKAIRALRDELRLPIIAGGMVTERDEIVAALDAGAVAVSTSKKRLWVSS